MSARSEIKDGALFNVLDRCIVYTEVLGWVYMGHARGNDVAAIRNKNDGTSLSFMGAKQ